MNYVVIISAIITIILAIISKVYGISIIYPTLMIVLTIILNVIANTIKYNKDKREDTNIKDILK